MQCEFNEGKWGILITAFLANTIQLKAQLPAHKFLQIHIFCIGSLDKTRGTDNKTLVMKSKLRLLVSSN